jgi:creatinine amidohydrolase
MFRMSLCPLALAIGAATALAQNPAPVSTAPEPAPAISAQTGLSVKWEELTTEDFLKAIDFAKNVCVLPFGIIEKHGPSGPLGTDLLNVRHATVTAALSEYAIVFPEYYFGQIAEAGSQAGTIVYQRSTQLSLLQETVAEMARNGCKKVFIINGHGGNNFLIQYFAQTQLDSPRDYVVYAYMGPGGGNQVPTPAQGGPSKPGVDGHAGESEISSVATSRPGLVHPERAHEESGADQNRLNLPPGVYTGIWWYAKYPNHYQGDAAGANKERGDILLQQRVASLVEAIKAVKTDRAAPALQQEFFEKEKNPNKTPQ